MEPIAHVRFADLPAILDAIRDDLDDEPRWLVLASWLCGKGRDDEAVVVRVFWPMLRDDADIGGSLHLTLRQVARYSKRLGRLAWGIEERRLGKGSEDE